MCSGSTKEQLT